MILINELLSKISLLEAKETAPKKTIQTTGHMTHAADWSIYGNPEHGLEHVEALRDWFDGKETSNHSVSLKADGGVSVVFGRKKDGRHFISYKSGKKLFHSPEEIDAAGVPWAEDGKKIFSKIAEMNIKPGTAFQGDMLWVDRDQLENGVARPNTIRYKSTKHPMAIAVHSQYNISDTEDLHKTSSVPDIKQLKHKDVFVPDLQLKAGSVKLSKSEKNKIDKSVKAAREALTPEAMTYVKGVPANKEIHKFLQEYFNEAVATTGRRSIADLRKYIDTALTDKVTSKAYMNKSSQKKLSASKDPSVNERLRKELRERLHQHITDNESNLSQLFKHHDHIADAKHTMLDALKRHQNKHPINPLGGEEHEGIVSALGVPGETETLAKFTREGESGFSSKNRERGVERFPEQYMKEEMGAAAVGGAAMTASSGNISGMGYNLGGPPPDDVKVSPEARYAYTRANMAQTPVDKSQPVRRRIVRKVLGNLNVGREAY
jgi:hypothetical protein